MTILVDRTVADYDHIGRVLAERLRVGPGRLHEIREREKARRRRRGNEVTPNQDVHACTLGWHARLAVRACCRAHGTTCPRCRAWDYHAPRWLVRLRDQYDAYRGLPLW